MVFEVDIIIMWIFLCYFARFLKIDYTIPLE